MTEAWASTDLTVLHNLPARLDDQLLAKVERIARLPVPPAKPCPEDFFLQCMRTLSTLPARADDRTTGELRLAVLKMHLGRYPKSALAFLTEKATAECRFFPSPAECLAILNRWERSDGPYRASCVARRALSRELQERLDSARRALRAGEATQQQVDALNDRAKRILATEGLLFDGTYQIRPRWKPAPASPEASDTSNNGKEPTT